MDIAFVPPSSLQGDFFCPFELPSRRVYLQQPEVGLPFHDAIAGCLWGLACGNALGAAVESLSQDEILRRFPKGVRELSQAQDGSSLFGLSAGHYTDDTWMTLCLCESLTARAGLDPDDVAQRWVNWSEEGPYWELGPTVQQALERLKSGIPPHRSGIESQGTGTALRAAPLGLFYEQGAYCRHAAALQARITHRHPYADAGAVALAEAVAWLARRPRQWSSVEFLEMLVTSVREFSVEFAELITRPRPIVDVLHQVDHTVPAAIQLFLHFRDEPEEAIVQAASSGGDTDTLAGLVGALMGAQHGLAAIPKRWRNGLKNADRIEQCIHDLHLVTA